MPAPFRIDIPAADIDDLHRRIAQARLPDDPNNNDGRYGVSREWLMGLLDHWRIRFDWRAEEARINALPQYRVVIEDVPIHFVRVPGRGSSPRPLLVTHGWPWTFWDWEAVIGPLSDPAAYGGDTRDSFDVIIPSLPGFGFSTPASGRKINVRAIGRLWHTLATKVLGYPRFFAAGGDWGSMITAELGHAYPEAVAGVHLTLPLLPGLNVRDLSPGRYAADERWMVARNVATRTITDVHVTAQRRAPQTLGYALEDSPTGLAAWLWERRSNWSDPACTAAVDPDRLCALASLYWYSRTITSSMRLYADHHDAPWQPLAKHVGPLIPVPTGFAVAPHELFLIPRAVAQEHTNLQQWTLFPSGGHFLPVEQPQLLVEEYRRLFRPFR